MDWGTRVGVHRNQVAIERGWQASFDRDKTLAAHIVGAQAELAFCRMLGLPWPHVENQWETLEPDVPPLWEVRYSSTPRRNKARPAPGHGFKHCDSPDAIIAHVSGRPPVFEVYGYINASWVQQNKVLEDPGEKGAPAHWFHDYDITPIDPGFHDLHAWFNRPFLGGWLCMICAEPYVGPLPVSSVYAHP